MTVKSAKFTYCGNFRVYGSCLSQSKFLGSVLGQLLKYIICDPIYENPTLRIFGNPDFCINEFHIPFHSV